MYNYRIFYSTNISFNFIWERHIDTYWYEKLTDFKEFCLFYKTSFTIILSISLNFLKILIISSIKIILNNLFCA